MTILRILREACFCCGHPVSAKTADALHDAKGAHAATCKGDTWVRA